MSKRIKVDVTREHIEVGLKKDCGSCPVALAIRSAIPNCAYVSVDPNRATVLPVAGKPLRRIPLPRTARDFISAFDHGWFGATISFELELEAA
jgi:hypothetical protein